MYIHHRPFGFIQIFICDIAMRLFFFFAVMLASSSSAAFRPTSNQIEIVSRRNNLCGLSSIGNGLLSPSLFQNSIQLSHQQRNSRTACSMAKEDEEQSLMRTISIGFVIILFVSTSIFLPLMEGGGSRDLSIADSVVTTQDNPNKLKDYEDNKSRLSRAAIQEKLNSLPIFYLGDGEKMQQNLYFSYSDALAATTGSFRVKATSLDQVMYPLILKRGRMRMADPPREVSNAESQILRGESPIDYKLVPSKAASQYANEFHMNLVEGDVPLFVADRLAFASSKGPQVPLFLEKDDCVGSYQRLRQSQNNRLPEEPTIRTASLFEVVRSMERGSRPGVSALFFQANPGDIQKATEVFQF